MEKNRINFLRIGISLLVIIGCAVSLLVFYIPFNLRGAAPSMLTPTKVWPAAASPTSASVIITTPAPTENTPSVDFEKIDQAIQKGIEGNMAYNAPAQMELDAATTIQLLISASLSTEDLKEVIQSTQTSPVESAQISLSPRMRAELKSADPDAFVIQALHASPEQLISSTEPTEWKWLLHAKKGGQQVLTLTVYRLVEYKGNEYWPETSFEKTINIKVTVGDILNRVDWKWFLGLIIPALLIPAFWKWYDARKKGKEESRLAVHAPNRPKTGRNL